MNHWKLFRLLAIAFCAACISACGSASSDDGGAAEPPPTSEPPPASSLPAFPEAEGFGADAIGGRDGQVIYVTNLDDSGEGSLREAISTSGPRIIVFGVGGTIELQSSLVVSSPFITIAGQTAPGGIQLRNGGGLTRAAIRVRTNDVVIRYLRVRTGPSEIAGGAPALGGIYISGEEAFNIILDHVSIQWAEDKALIVFGGARDVTVQWSILAETLYCANHEKSYGTGGICSTGGGPHSRGITISSEPDGTPPSPNNISIHHNLLAHFNKRYPNVTSDTFVDLVNNVFYNLGVWGSNVGVKSPQLGWVARMNYVNNAIIGGPNTQSGIYALTSDSSMPDGTAQIYIVGNSISGPIIDIAPPDFENRGLIVEIAHAAEPVATQSVGEAMNVIYANAGANLPQRDSVDQRIVDEARFGSGAYIDDPSQVGGWPMLGGIAAPLDTDMDGMPDEWETTFGLNSSTDDSAGDVDGDGYTNIEEFLNGTNP